MKRTKRIFLKRENCINFAFMGTWFRLTTQLLFSDLTLVSSDEQFKKLCIMYILCKQVFFVIMTRTKLKYLIIVSCLQARAVSNTFL